jgi:hypothetical protein
MPLSTLEGFDLTLVEQTDASDVNFEYVRRTDTLFLMLVKEREPHATYFLADGVHLMCSAGTKRVVGFRVEHWRKLFLQRRRGLAPHWYWFCFTSWLSRLIKAFKPSAASKARLYRAVVDYARA